MTASSGTLLPIAWLPRGASIQWTSPALLGLTDATSKRSVGSTGDPSGDCACGAIIHARTSATTATPLQVRVIAPTPKAEIVNPQISTFQLGISPHGLSTSSSARQAICSSSIASGGAATHLQWTLIFGSGTQAEAPDKVA